MSAEPLALLSATQIRELVSSELRAVLEAHQAERPPAPLLASGAELARLLGCSRSTVHKLREQGAPAVKLGDTFKYEPAQVVAWLKDR